MLGDKIRSIRKAKGLSINKLAKLTDISLGYLSDLENNKSKNPSLEKLEKIAAILDVTTDSFFKSDNDLYDSKSNEASIDKKEKALYETNEFKTAEEAMQFILKQPTIMGYGGFDINKMSDEDLVDFANELLNQMKLISYKYKK
ncbi:Transcriptional regulator, contains XRE-family HTH domain [Clostridium cavendishii DSM 21758]|uniref:Transcriptional regulator, contains XRE-family HTH domain n=1 Tax=Clostridium cavendishii DSM 21758 TaxID=1121302 RepID=A0A1M6HS32_9CLOT|nr:helix-turn-helix transcriptional regulator [Clostridium cavendishii]SHJ24973.1 Transcriptional regulator, contains XRE-family HTH domain [Clostridium cavendishii DSM 21758]